MVNKGIRTVLHDEVFKKAEMIRSQNRTESHLRGSKRVIDNDCDTRVYGV